MFQHIKKFSERACDTEYWMNDCSKFNFAIARINYILKDIKIEKKLIMISQNYSK